MYYYNVVYYLKSMLFRYHHLLILFFKLTGLLFMWVIYMIQIVLFTSYLRFEQ
jgi:hypothetical protein